MNTLIASSILLWKQPVRIQIRSVARAASRLVACNVGNVWPDCEMSKTHVFAVILLSSTTSDPENKTLEGLILPIPNNLLALIVMIFN